jgi:CubicO group peptidase (beta-lactamase class C family)
MKKISLFVICLLTIIYVNAQENDLKSSINSFIAKLDSTFNGQFGISLCVVKDDKTVYKYSRGYADYSIKEMVSEDTRFYLSSVTKSFTALAALILDNKGAIDLDKPIVEYFPDLDSLNIPNVELVKIRDLLTHTSGLSNDFLTDRKAYYGNYDQKILQEVFSKFTTSNNVGYGKFEYDNLGYNLFELILEKDLKKDWKQVVEEEVLVPAGMNKTSASVNLFEQNGISIAQPHFQTDMAGNLEVLNTRKNDKTLHAAGGHYTTAGDMVKWLIIQLNRGMLNGEQIFPAEIIDLSHQPQTVQEQNYIDLSRYGYAFGWQLGYDADGDTLIHHFGGFPGHHSEVMFNTNNRIGVSVMVNEGGGIGIVCAYLLASFSIDYFLHPEGLLEKYSNMLSPYSQMASENFKSIEKEKNERSKRKWELELPFEEYTGIYTSRELGSIEISYNEELGFFVKHGIIESNNVEPFTKANSMRVDILNNGVVFKFVVKEGNIESLIQEGVTYYKE